MFGHVTIFRGNLRLLTLYVNFRKSIKTSTKTVRCTLSGGVWCSRRSATVIMGTTGSVETCRCQFSWIILQKNKQALAAVYVLYIYLNYPCAQGGFFVHSSLPSVRHMLLFHPTLRRPSPREWTSVLIQQYVVQNSHVRSQRMWREPDWHGGDYGNTPKDFEKQAFLLPFNMSSEVKWNGSPLAFLIDRLFRAAARRWLVCSGKIIALFSFSFSYSFRERMFQIFLHNHGVKNCISTFWLCSSTSLQAHCAVHGMKMLPFAKDSLCCFLLARVYGCMWNDTRW